MTNNSLKMKMPNIIFSKSTRTRVRWKPQTTRPFTCGLLFTPDDTIDIHILRNNGSR